MSKTQRREKTLKRLRTRKNFENKRNSKKEIKQSLRIEQGRVSLEDLRKDWEDIEEYELE